MTRAEEKTVLVVEDEPDVRLFLRTVLEDAGFNVITAEDGEIAWQTIRERRPDFISLDLFLPKRSGRRLLRDLKADPDLAGIPLLILTAHADDDLAREEPEDVLNRFINEGPGRLLRKPVRPVDFVRCVQQALGIAATEQVEERLGLKDKVQKLMADADSEALKAALKALRQE